MSGQQSEGRVWFITGCSSGFGWELGRAVLGLGDRLMATARDTSALAGLAAVAPGRLRSVRLDVTDAESIHAAVAEAGTAFGRIDVLVNNAGYGLAGTLEELAEQDLRRQFETNLFGTLAVTRAVLPVLRRQRSGHIVQMSSVNGVTPVPGGSAYSGTKFALDGMSEALAAEVAHLGIRVTILEPGAFRTDFNGRSIRWSEPMPEYAEFMEPELKEFEAFRGNEPGDPARAAQAIIAAVDMDDPPLRLPLGPDAIAEIRSYLQARLSQLDAVEAIGAGTDFR
jgi:NAD(P)-dependent dehydrogenase (short-subunit alcohol dehydrogenase family)